MFLRPCTTQILRHTTARTRTSIALPRNGIQNVTKSRTISSSLPRHSRMLLHRSSAGQPKTSTPLRTKTAAAAKLACHDTATLGLLRVRIPMQRSFLPQLHGHVRISSLTTAAGASSKQSTSSSGRALWKRLAGAVRYVRIPILVYSVYSLGYQQGVMECTKRPIALQNEICRSILLSTGVVSADQVQIVNEQDIVWHSPAQHHQVAAVGQSIISAAREYVNEEVQLALNEVKKHLPADISEEHALEYYRKDEKVQFWHEARLRLQGEGTEKGQPWSYIFIHSAAPNAFVTEILPQKFFITTGMLELANTPQELAVVLGHEVSHLILGHISSANYVETMLRTLEVLLLSLDPTAGLLSLAVVGVLATARGMLTAAFSRENELEADELGLKIAARACFDTTAGIDVMYKLHQHSVALSRDPSPSMSSAATGAVVKLMDTHPPSLDRYKILQDMVVTENPAKYKNTHCQKVTNSFFQNLFWGTK